MKFNVSIQDKNKCGVYRITNLINKKIYIGSTGISFYLRYHQHKNDYKSKRSRVRLLCRAFDKYGIENFDFSIVCICDEIDRIRMEQFYIDNGSDYNCAKKAGTLLGIKHLNNAKTRTCGGNHHSAIKIEQYNLSGNFIKSFACVNDAKKAVGLVSKSGILEVCRGNTYSAGGFRWSYFGKKLIDRPDRLGKIPILIDSGGVYIKFDSTGDVAKYFEISRSTVVSALTRSSKLFNYNITKAF